MGKDLDFMNVHGHVDRECVAHRPYRGWVTKLASEEPVPTRGVRVVKRAIGLIGDLKNLSTQETRRSWINVLYGRPNRRQRAPRGADVKREGIGLHPNIHYGRAA